MNTLLSLVRTFVPDAVLRAKVLQELRIVSAAASAWVLTSLYVFLTTHVHAFSQTDDMAIATVVATAVGGLVLAIGSAVFSWLDPEKVDAKVQQAHVDGQVLGAQLATSSPQAAAKVAAVSGTPEALADVLAKLKAASGQ